MKSKRFYYDPSPPSYTLLDKDLVINNMDNIVPADNNPTEVQNPAPAPVNEFKDNQRLLELFTTSYGRIYLFMIILFVYTAVLTGLYHQAPRTEGYFTNYLNKSPAALLAYHCTSFTYSTQIYLGSTTRENACLGKFFLPGVFFSLATIGHLVSAIWQ